MLIALLTFIGASLWLSSEILRLEPTAETEMTQKWLAVAAPACFVMVSLLNCFGVCSGKRIQ